jgi:hypothetical protein
MPTIELTSKPYWLHLSRNASEGDSITYEMLRTDSPSDDMRDGASPTVNYVSWEMLMAALRYIKIPEGTIEDAGKELRSQQHCILHDIHLTDGQLAKLRFPNKN